MEKAFKQVALSLVLTYLALKSGHSELIVFPRDTEALVDHSTYFNCSTSIRSEQIHWYHYRVGENKTNYVYYKGQFNKDYADRYSIAIDTGTGEYNLIIRSVQPGDAGRYVCQDDGGLGSLSSAELIVLDSTPMCQSSMKPEGLVGPNSCGLPIDKLQLSCSASYSGNIPPILQWKMDGDDAPISKGIAIDYSGKRVTMNLTMSSELEMDRALYTCSNTRSHDKQYSCTTGPVKVNYAVDQPTILNIRKGETITCSANTTVPCTYRWFYGNDTLFPASCHQVLTTNRLEDNSCEATCPMNGLRCTFVAMRIFVFENEASTAAEDTTKTLLLAILIPVVAILLIIICVLSFIIIRKDEANNDEVSRRNDNTSADNRVETKPMLRPTESSPPNCTSNYSGENFITMQCSSNFRGFWAPTMQWTRHDSSGNTTWTGEEVKGKIENQTIPEFPIMCSRSVSRDSLSEGTYFSCKIYFEKTFDGMNATNIPDCRMSETRVFTTTQ